MTLAEYITTNKIKKDVFIALHNKDDIWVIYGTADDSKLVEYMNYNVLSDKATGMVKVVQLDYDKTMSLAYYRMKEEQKATVAVSNKSTKTETKRKRKK